MKEYSLEIPEHELAVEMLRLDPLGEADQKRILDFVTYNGNFDPSLITNAVGRNILFPFVEPIGSLDTVQISGAGHFDFGTTDNDGGQVVLIPNSLNGPIRPPSKNSGRFTHTTTVVLEGKDTTIVQNSPLGSYTEQAAREKFTNSIRATRLATAANCPFIVPLPITRIHYQDIPDGQGGRQSALVWGCPAKGARADGHVFALFNHATANLDKKQQEDTVSKKFQTFFLPLLNAMGRSARFLHQHGLCHYQMTYGNISPLLRDRHGRPKICLYDWETLLPTDAINPLLARAYDLGGVLGTNSAVLGLISERVGMSPESLFTLGYNSFLHFLSGYTGEDPNSLHTNLNLTQNEIFQSFESPHKVLDLLVDTVLPRIDR
ncbi:hypothetical protein HYU91_02855 [Candidatus Collierbacteria bacterium]|nr:hypothetical protein [Candidatus Collierbacteria bacterium]